MRNPFSKGQAVKFKPASENWLDDYSPDGVQPGDLGVVSAEVVFDDEVIVDFTRQDGTVSDGFFAFPEDLEAV